ncbi:MAG: DUF3179 domain-containing (seleno)protein, partial [Bradymonadaceae bacterium]
VGFILLAVVAAACSTPEKNSDEAMTQTPTPVVQEFDGSPVTVGLEAGLEPERSAAEVYEGADRSDSPRAGELILQDIETGSLWNLRGEAFAGELRGARLRQLPAFSAFWFGWSVFHHGGEIWNRDEDNLPGELSSGEGDCLVRCDEILLSCAGGQDCIPALNEGENLELVAAGDPGASYLSEDAIVLGVAIDGEARAYPHNILWWHEIANDSIGDVEFSVTYCPLTESGIVFSRSIDGQTADFGISGQLYNSNLVMFNRNDEAFFSQLLGQQVTGDSPGRRLEHMPVVQTTWSRWKELYPETLVVTTNTGFHRDYDRYPYGDYRTDDTDTFRPTEPLHQPTYRTKDQALAIMGEETSRAYAFPEIEKSGERVVINDVFEGEGIVVVYETIQANERQGMAIPFSAVVDGRTLQFVGLEMP